MLSSSGTLGSETYYAFFLRRITTASIEKRIAHNIIATFNNSKVKVKSKEMSDDNVEADGAPLEVPVTAEIKCFKVGGLIYYGEVI